MHNLGGDVVTLEEVSQSEESHGQEVDPNKIIDRPVVIVQLGDMEKNTVNPSTPRPEGWDWLRVDPERCVLLRLKGRSLGAAEVVNSSHRRNCKMPTGYISTSPQKKSHGA